MSEEELPTYKQVADVIVSPTDSIVLGVGDETAYVDFVAPENQIATIGDLEGISQGPSGVVAVASPITNTGTSTSANIGIDQSGFDHIGNLDYVQFDTTNTTVPTTTGRVAWNEAEGTLDLKLKDGVTLQIGQETVAMVANYTNALIPEGAAVYVVGAQGQRLKVALADASAESTSAATLGIVTQTGGIPHGTSGYITTQGLVRQLNIPTASFEEGGIIWLSTTPGQWTSTRPDAPDHGVQIGYVVKTSNGNAGEIYVHPQNGYELDELHSVNITNPQPGDVLTFNGTIWTNQQPQR